MSLLNKWLVVLCSYSIMHFSSYAENNAIYVNNLEWPPFFFSKHTDGKIGFAKEILDICLQQTNYQHQYKTLPIRRTHLYMQTGELDISVYSYKDERNSFVHYGKEVIFTSSYALASKKASQIKINKLEDLNNHTIGHLSGLTHTPELLKIIELKNQKNDVSIGHNLDAMFSQMLATPQRFEIMPSSKETLQWRVKQLGISDKVRIHDFIVAEKKYYITISKFSKSILEPLQLLTQLDNCIVSLKTNNNYQKIAEKYGLD